MEASGGSPDPAVVAEQETPVGVEIGGVVIDVRPVALRVEGQVSPGGPAVARGDDTSNEIPIRGRIRFGKGRGGRRGRGGL